MTIVLDSTSQKTALDLITGALRKIGQYAPGETISAEDSTDALDTLNAMLDVWSIQHLMVFNQVETVATLTAGKSAYTVGPGGDFDMVRPSSITRCYSRVGTVDFPCEVVTVEKYTGIGIKSQPGPWPKMAYFNTSVPLGALTVWPVPNAGVEFHMWSDEVLSSLQINDAISLPKGYFLALQYSLAELLCSEYGMPVPADVRRLAKQYRDIIKGVNANPQSEAPVDAALISSSGNNAGWILTGGFQ